MAKFYSDSTSAVDTEPVVGVGQTRKLHTNCLAGFARAAATLALFLALVLTASISASAAEEQTSDAAGTPAALPVVEDTSGSTSTGEVPSSESSITETDASSLSSVQVSSETENEGAGTPTSGDENGEPDDGSVASGDTEEDGTTGSVDSAVAIVVTIWDCTVDPGLDDPATVSECAPDADVSVSATENDVPLTDQVTDVNGQAAFSVADGSAFAATEAINTIEPGYSPKGSGSISGVASDGAAFTIVNLQNDLIGRIQVAAGMCPTLGDPYTTFHVIGPLVRSASLACAAHAGAEFEITGPGIDGSLSAITDSEGNWLGNLPVGIYTIANSAASAEFNVAVDSTTLLVTVDYYTGPQGTLTIERYECSEGESNDIQITVHYGGGGGPLNGSCQPSPQSVEIFSSENGGEPIVADLGEDGQTSVEVAVGDYLIRDQSGTEASAQVTDAGWTQAVINVVSVSGAVSAQLNFCSDPMSNFEDPSSSDYWSSSCHPAAPGDTVELLNNSGDVVASAETGGEGSAYFDNLPPGTYEFSGGDALCALFANVSDARGGFNLNAGEVVHVAAYGCATPSTEPPANGNGDVDSGSNGGANSSGGNNTGGTSGLDSTGQHGLSVGNMTAKSFSPSSTSQSGLYVRTLPSTGDGPATSHQHWTIAVLSGMMLLLLLGWVSRQFRPRLARYKHS